MCWITCETVVCVCVCCVIRCAEPSRPISFIFMCLVYFGRFVSSRSHGAWSRYAILLVTHTHRVQHSFIIYLNDLFAFSWPFPANITRIRLKIKEKKKSKKEKRGKKKKWDQRKKWRKHQWRFQLLSTKAKNDIACFTRLCLFILNFVHAF